MLGILGSFSGFGRYLDILAVFWKIGQKNEHIPPGPTVDGGHAEPDGGVCRHGSHHGVTAQVEFESKR
jgi:hypothetical protein